jgi:hypothetical protein
LTAAVPQPSGHQGPPSRGQSPLVDEALDLDPQASGGGLFEVTDLPAESAIECQADVLGRLPVPHHLAGAAESGQAIQNRPAGVHGPVRTVGGPRELGVLAGLLEGRTQPRHGASGLLGKARQRRVQTVEEALLRLGRLNQAPVQPVVGEVVPPNGQEGHGLTLMPVDADPRQLLVAAPRDRIERATVDPQEPLTLELGHPVSESDVLTGLPVADR